MSRHCRKTIWIALAILLFPLASSSRGEQPPTQMIDQPRDAPQEPSLDGLSLGARIRQEPAVTSKPPDPLSLATLIDAVRPEEDFNIRPPVLRSVDEPAAQLPGIAEGEDHTNPLLRVPAQYPYGFTGPSGVQPTEVQTSSHFVPVEDRWRIGSPDWDRYGKGHPIMDDYPGVKGAWYDPYNENVLKGDFPIIGQHTFLRLTARSQTLIEGRQLPTPTTPFEATQNPGQGEFFGDPNQLLAVQQNSFITEIFHGNSAFKPADWRVRLNLIHNLNYLDVNELGVVNPDVREGTDRFRTYFVPEEYFVEAKLADTSAYYDFMSVRAGSQFFTSDFRGFIFSDINRGVRLFGTRLSNRDQYNVMWLDQTEKDTNSLLNRFDESRPQNTWIANYYRQDFLYPGNNASVSFHANHERPSIEFDRNNFLVRPDPVGVFSPHEVRSYYLGAATNGHIERYNLSSAFYYVFGHDNLNPLAGRPVDISAFMAAVELSYDRDWVRFRTSYLYNSGDEDTNDSKATGFDAILANPNFAGTEFSYWGRQGVRLFGVELTNRLSQTPAMKQSKFQSQQNFVNPGLHLFNIGLDADITPRLKSINNTNFLWFDQTDPLETYLFTGNVDRYIGADISTGLEYRPLLNNNILFLGGFATLISGEGFQDLFRELEGRTRNHVAGFVEMTFEF